MKKVLGCLVLALLFSVMSLTPVYAGVRLQENGTDRGIVEYLNFPGGSITRSGRTGTLYLKGLTSSDGNEVITATGEVAAIAAYTFPYSVNSTTDATTVLATQSGKVFIATTACTYTLPTAAVGLRYTFVDGTGIGISVDPASTSDTIYYLGLDAGDKISSASVTGDSISLICGAANSWYLEGRIGSWTDGG